MNDLNQLVQDIVTAAQIVEAPYSETVIRQTLAAFGGFARSSVQFRTTTKPTTHRRLDVRYEEIHSPEPPLNVARRAGYFADQGREIDRLLPELYEKFPCVADGADFDVLDGVTKLWFFPKGVIPTENIFKVASLPAGVGQHRAYYEQYHLNNIYIIGVDFHSQSMNLYFRFDHPSHHTPEALRGMVKDLDFDAPPEEAIMYSLPGISAALTYSWNSAAVERICFYVGHPNRAAAPVGLHPVIARFVNEVPALHDSLYQVSWTFGRKGTYIKVENDYTGDMMTNIVPAIMAG